MFVFWGVCLHIFSPAKRCSPNIFHTRSYRGYRLGETLREMIERPPSPPKKNPPPAPIWKYGTWRGSWKKKTPTREGKERRRQENVYTWNLIGPFVLRVQIPPSKKGPNSTSTQGSTSWFQVYTVGKNGKAASELCSRFQTSDLWYVENRRNFCSLPTLLRKKLGGQTLFEGQLRGASSFTTEISQLFQKLGWVSELVIHPNTFFSGGIGNPKDLLRLGF